MQKHPLYTAVGWAVLTIGKRKLRSKITKQKSSGGRTLKLTLLSLGVSVGATLLARKVFEQPSIEA